MHAGMAYMERWREIRRDPRLLLDGAGTVISIAFNYRQENPYPQIATYALGEDYHKVLRKRLKKVTAALREEYGGEYRICIDSAPILERYWARRCGVGYRSPVSGNIVVPGVGSMVFLAEIITTNRWASWSDSADCGEAIHEASPAISDLSPCPTKALQPGGRVDSRRCINYLTIEHKGEWDELQRALMESPGACGKIFGCDICQLACPSNSSSPRQVLPEFKPLPQLHELIETVKNRDIEALQSLDISKSPLSRTGIEGLLRNAPTP